MIITIILAIVVFSLLVILHELGHFTVAKAVGVRVNEFWLGMGPALLKKKGKETTYCLRALPIGGAVVMEGEDGQSDDPRSFSNAKLGWRALILAAGPLMNLLIGFLIVLCLLAPSEQSGSTVIDSFADGFSATQLQVGDRITKIDGHGVHLVNDVSYALARGDGVYDITVKRQGETVKLDDVSLTPQVFEGESRARYGFQFVVREASVGTLLHDAFFTSYSYGRMIWDSLGDLISGKVGINQLSGPVGVSVVLGETAKSSMTNMLFLVAFISINLGIMNLLPIPALDGGRLLFILIELIWRKPVPAKYESYVHGAGLALLMLLMIYVTFHDIFMVVTG